MAGRHAAVKPSKTSRRNNTSHTPIIISAILILIIGMGATCWFLPAEWVPFPKALDQCTVTGGGTLRVYTKECGTLYYRGHANVDKNITYTVAHTGPFAWLFQETSQPETVIS